MSVKQGDVEEIRSRWASREWPSIGYFVHGQAYMDIQTLLAHIQLMQQQQRSKGSDNGR